MTDTSLVFNILAKENMSKTLNGLKGVAAGAGVAIGAALSVGVQKNLDISTSNAKLQGQLGLTTEVSARAGEVAGEVYRDNFGGSIADVNVAIKAVGTNMVDLKKVSKAELTEMTEAAMGIASTFDVDVNEATRAAGILVKNKLAPDFKTAFDLITRSMQEGGDRAGDLLDTISEYSPQFSKLGIDGSAALGIMTKGLAAGARDTDVIADAIKEFGLRAIDTAELTTDAYKDLGLSADGMRKQIAAGGPAAETAMSQVVRALMKVKDPVKQNEIGVALFGTQWEDTARKILPALDPLTAGMTDVAGATDKMNAAVGNTPQAKIDGVTRAMEGWLNQLIELPGPMGATAAAAAAFGAPALSMLGDIGQLRTAIGGRGGLNPALADAKTKIDAAGTSASTNSGKLRGLAVGAGAVGTALAVTNVASAAFGQNSAAAGTSTKLLSQDLLKYAKTGKEAGEITELFGGGARQLNKDLVVLDKSGLAGVGTGIGKFTENITGLGSVMDDSIQHSTERLGALDQAMASLVTSGHPAEAKKAFEQLAARGADVGVSVAEMKKGFPAFVVAAKEAGIDLDNLAKPRTVKLSAAVNSSSANASEQALNRTSRGRKAPITATAVATAVVDRALNRTARNRWASYAAAVNTSSANAAEYRLNQIARDRRATINVSSANAAEHRAGGGPVRKGQPYIVGENRPELFVPGTDGTILPQVPEAMGGGGGGGGTVRVVLDLIGADAELKRRIQNMVRVEGRGNVQVTFGQGKGK